MGLDSVELVMAVEEEFSFEISDAEAERMLRVGDMYTFVLEKLRARGEVVDDAEVWKRVRTIVVEQLGVHPDQVTPDARFIEDLGVN